MPTYLNKDNEKIIVWVGVGLAAIVVFNVIGGVKSIAETFGLKDSADTKLLNNASQDPGSFWSPNFYKAGGANTLLLTRAAAELLAKQMYQAFGAFNDNEESVIGVFRSLKTQSQASFLAAVFQDLYGQDLLTFLRGGSWPQDRLSDTDVTTINNFVSKLPKYYI